MKDIIVIFLKAIMAGAVMVALLILFNNVGMNVNGSQKNGMLNILGAAADKESVAYDSLTDVDTMQDIVSQTRPVIEYTQPEVVRRNEVVNLISCFSVTEFNGTDFVTDNAINEHPDKVYIKSIVKDDRATSVMSLYDDASGNITFQEPGVYFVTIAIRDNENRENTMTVRLPVRLEEV